PGQLMAAPAEAVRRILCNGWADFLVKVRGSGYAAFDQRSHEDVHTPLRMQYPVQNQSGTYLEGHSKVQPLDVFAIGGNACVNGHHQYRNMRSFQSRQQLIDASNIAWKICLIPASISGSLLQSFQRNVRRSAYHKRNPSLGCHCCKGRIAFVHDDSGKARWSKTHWHRIRLPENRYLTRALLDRLQASMPESDALHDRQTLG